MNLWGEDVQPKQPSKKAAPAKDQKQEQAPDMPTTGRIDYYRNTAVTSESNSLHFATRLEAAHNMGTYNTNSIKDIRQQLKFEESRRLQLIEMVNNVTEKMESLLAKMTEISETIDELEIAVVNERNDETDEEE